MAAHRSEDDFEVNPSDSEEHAQPELFTFPVSIRDVLRHLHADMRDDWFKDALLHVDLFANSSNLVEVVNEILLEGNGRYEATGRIVYDIPKKGLGTRYALETDFYDRFAYQAICSYLLPFYDPLLSHRVLGHRYNRGRSGTALFKGRIELWKTFEGVTKTSIANGQALLATDVINFFENITIELVRESFERMLPSIKASGAEKMLIRNAIGTLCDLLGKWGYSERHGLPQNRDASSFIANVVLNAVDHEMVRLGYDYYRYVDDIRVICDTQRAARKAAGILIGQLRTVGMNINSSKTTILHAGSDTDEIKDFFISADDRVNAIDCMWRSKSRRVILRSIRYIHQLIEECVESSQTQSRQFRFAVNRLALTIDAGIHDRRTEQSARLKSFLIDSLEEQAVSTDQMCRILTKVGLSQDELEKIEDFLCDSERSIHPWQNGQLWTILARAKYKSERLVNLARHRIYNELQRSEVAAIFIYLCCVGEVESLKRLVSQFSDTWPYYHKRNFLLATHTLDRADLKPVFEHLGPRLRKTVSRAKSHFIDGLPLVQERAEKITGLYNLLSSYD